ncbi:MAG: mechanosensitive ion channel [Tenericutes bacterium]|nr:mechanosensitive ion channel [Mycoplasmatota bacterium]
MEKFLEKLVDGCIDISAKLLLAVVILAIGSKIIKIVENNLRKENKLKHLDASVKGFLISFISITSKIVLFIAILHILGVPTASIITVFGSCAVAIGLALQGGLSNIAGGLMILIFKPFKVGDYIEVSGKEGTVKSITMFYTTITTFDNKLIQLPNGSLSNSNITNYTANKKRRVDIDISVSYSSDIDKVKKVINELISKNELVLQEENNYVKLSKHDDSALVFAVRVWTKTENYWDLYFDLMESIKKTLDKNKIEIPFPQMDVHINK